MRRAIILLALFMNVGNATSAEFGLYEPQGKHAFDFWFTKDDSTYYAFYLQHRPGDPNLTIGMATSQDLVSWKEFGEVLTPNPSGQWSDRSLATGSTWRRGSDWLMVFTGHSNAGPSGIGLAKSSDLRSWNKVGNQPVEFKYRVFSVPQAAYWQDKGFAAGQTLRYTVIADPYVLPEPIEGWFYMAANAVITGEPLDRRGCTGLLRSKNGSEWEDCGIIAAPREFDRLETPQLWKHGNRWYLFFGGAREQPNYRANFVYSSESLSGPFVPSAKSELKLPEKQWFYIAKILRDPQGRDVLLACLGGARLSRPYVVSYSSDGSLSLAVQP